MSKRSKAHARWLWLLMAITLVAAAACGGSNSDSEKTGTTAQAACPSQPPLPKYGQCWTAIEESPGNCVYYTDYDSCAEGYDTTGALSLVGQFAFLWEHDLQFRNSAYPHPLDHERAGVLFGRVFDENGDPLPNVMVDSVDDAVPGRVWSEYGKFDPPGTPPAQKTGRYFLAANTSGAPVRLRFTLDGYLPAERIVQAVAGRVIEVPDVHLLPEPTNLTTVPSGSGSWIVANGADEAIGGGQTRTSRLIFPPGAWTGTGNLQVGLKEYTVGPNGPDRMPAPLPPYTAYTYAVELFAKDSSGTVISPSFQSEVILYVDAPVAAITVGKVVPSGYYDVDDGVWKQHLDAGGDPLNAKVVKILSVTGGAADIDTGNGVPDTSIPLGERQQLGALVSTGKLAVNDVLWRAAVRHFSTTDVNPPPFAPPGSGPPSIDDEIEDPSGSCATSGSIIECDKMVLGENIPIPGTPFGLVYRSRRTDQFKVSISVTAVFNEMDHVA